MADKVELTFKRTLGITNLEDLSKLGTHEEVVKVLTKILKQNPFIPKRQIPINLVGPLTFLIAGVTGGLTVLLNIYTAPLEFLGIPLFFTLNLLLWYPVFVASLESAVYSHRVSKTIYRATNSQISLNSQFDNRRFLKTMVVQVRRPALS